MGLLSANVRKESKKTWQVAAPAILTGVLQFSIGFVTAAFVGHLGDLQLAAVSVAQNVIEGLAYGILMGMGSALETLCGQAVGAGHLRMLGVYLQRSWVISIATAAAITPLYVLASPVLKLLRQSPEISELAGKYALWTLPQAFAFAVNFPLQKFFQSQSKVWVMAAISGAVLAIHALLNWVLVAKLGYGLAGAAAAGDASWWLICAAQYVYLVSGGFRESWTGFSVQAFRSLAAFVKLSMASAIMLCLELWYFTAVIILVGCLKNPTVAVSAISICMNYAVWALMITLGFTVSVSVRVSNELGAGRAKAARFAVAVNVATSAAIGAGFMAAALAARERLPRLFSDVPEVVSEAAKLGFLLAATMFISSIQPVLSGVAIGAGWQWLVALINIGCYYLIGLPMGAVFGFKLKHGALGIWAGMLMGSVLQTAILLLITGGTKWQNEAMQAEERVRTWGQGIDPEAATAAEATGVPTASKAADSTDALTESKAAEATDTPTGSKAADVTDALTESKAAEATDSTPTESKAADATDALTESKAAEAATDAPTASKAAKATDATDAPPAESKAAEATDAPTASEEAEEALPAAPLPEELKE